MDFWPRFKNEGYIKTKKGYLTLFNSIHVLYTCIYITKKNFIKINNIMKTQEGPKKIKGGKNLDRELLKTRQSVNQTSLKIAVKQL